MGRRVIRSLRSLPEAASNFLDFRLFMVLLLSVLSLFWEFHRESDCFLLLHWSLRKHQATHRDFFFYHIQIHPEELILVSWLFSHVPWCRKSRAVVIFYSLIFFMICIRLGNGRERAPFPLRRNTMLFVKWEDEGHYKKTNAVLSNYL